MDGGRAFDASSCMLFEWSGDSESEFYNAAAEVKLGLGVAAVEDDAESSNCGSLAGRVEIHDGGGHDLLDPGFDDSVDEDGAASVDGGCFTSTTEDGVVDQYRGGKAGAEFKKSKGCEDSNMNERETDRLFWEACLAS